MHHLTSVKVPIFSILQCILADFANFRQWPHCHPYCRSSAYCIHSELHTPCTRVVNWCWSIDSATTSLAHSSSTHRPITSSCWVELLNRAMIFIQYSLRIVLDSRRPIFLSHSYRNFHRIGKPWAQPCDDVKAANQSEEAKIPQWIYWLGSKKIAAGCRLG
jgi:hypothetical protein